MYDYHYGGFPMMGFGMFLIFIFIITILYFIFKDVSKVDKHKSPQDILDERYAKGDIELEEYKKRSENLKK